MSEKKKANKHGPPQQARGSLCSVLGPAAPNSSAFLSIGSHFPHLIPNLAWPRMSGMQCLHQHTCTLSLRLKCSLTSAKHLDLSLLLLLLHLTQRQFGPVPPAAPQYLVFVVIPASSVVHILRNISASTPCFLSVSALSSSAGEHHANSTLTPFSVLLWSRPRF